jgi:hypothetical protein
MYENSRYIHPSPKAKEEEMWNNYIYYPIIEKEKDGNEQMNEIIKYKILN